MRSGDTEYQVTTDDKRHEALKALNRLIYMPKAKFVWSGEIAPSYLIEKARQRTTRRESAREQP